MRALCAAARWPSSISATRSSVDRTSAPKVVARSDRAPIARGTTAIVAKERGGVYAGVFVGRSFCTYGSAAWRSCSHSARNRQLSSILAAIFEKLVTIGEWWP